MSTCVCSSSVLQYLSNVVDVSIPNKTGETSLHTALRHQHSNAVVLAMLGSRHGAEAANKQDSMGQTVLHRAIFRYSDDYEGIVRGLSRVINASVQEHQGITALHYGVELSKFAFVDILLYEHKTNIFLQDCQGNTPLILACKVRTIKTCSHLSLILQWYQYGVAYGENMV